MAEPSNKVLLVEDDQTHRELIQRAFAKETPRIRLVARHDLEGAHELLGAGKQIDLIISDLNLPDGRGTELVNTDGGDQRPVIIITAYGSERIAVEAMKSGAIDYVVKTPDNLAGLPLMAERALREWDLKRQRQVAVHALERSQEKLALAQEIAHLGNWEVDPATDQVRCSLEACRVLALSRSNETTAGFASHYNECTVNGPCQRLENLLARVREVDTDTGSFDHTFQTEAGEKRIVSVFWRRLPPEHPGGTGRLFGTVQDVTEQRELAANLSRSQQLAAVGVLAGGVAHQFNNLHMTVLGNLDLTLMSQTITDLDRRHLHAARRAVMQAADVTRDLLAFAERAGGKKSPTDIDDLVESVLDRRRQELESARIRVTWKPGCAGRLMVCRDHLAQALKHLLVNAEHAMLGCPTRHLTVATGVQGDVAYIQVRDTGCGIPAADLPQLMLPFFSTKGEHAPRNSPLCEVHGTGLGLSVANTFVHDHGGDITVESTVDKGSTFTIWLPISAPVLTSSITCFDGTVSKMLGGRGHEILVIDDDPMVREVLTEILSAAGYRITALADAAAGLELLADRRFDLLLLDLQMPHMTGFQFLRELANIDLPAPIAVMVVTGRIDEASKQELDDFGVTEIVYKPFSRKDILARVQNALTHA